MWAPTLGTGVSSLPPEGANFPWGGPAENWTPMLGTGVSSPSPEGAIFLGAARRGALAPTFAHLRVARRPPRGLFRLGAARRRNVRAVC